MLAVCRHPLTLKHSPDLARISREALVDFINNHPNGQHPADPATGRVPVYQFWMRLAQGLEGQPGIRIAGGVSLRVGTTPNIEKLVGHIGYHVYPIARGRQFAERSCRLLLPLARRVGFSTIWITCNPENIASRRTCERLGAELVEIVPVPRDHELYARGDHEKCRYRLVL